MTKVSKETTKWSDKYGMGTEDYVNLMTNGHLWSDHPTYIAGLTEEQQLERSEAMVILAKAMGVDEV